VIPEYGPQWSTEISFTPTAEQGYPNYAGLALLGYTTLPLDAAAYRLFRAYDGQGNDITGDVRIDLIHLPTSTPLFSTLGDQFVGIYSDNGISKILLSSSRFDHLQYGYTIPEAGVPTLTAIAGLLLLNHRRHRVTQRF
jgi:hypothetical protein